MAQWILVIWRDSISPRRHRPAFLQAVVNRPFRNAPKISVSPIVACSVGGGIVVLGLLSILVIALFRSSDATVSDVTAGEAIDSEATVREVGTVVASEAEPPATAASGYPVMLHEIQHTRNNLMQLITSPMRVFNVCVLVILGTCVGCSRNPTNGSSSNDELLKSGLEKLDAKQYEDAIEIFTQLAEQSPTATHHALIGDCYWKQRKLEEADIHYRKALGLDPKHCGANHALGRDAVLLKRYQDAVPYLDAANDLCAGSLLHAQNLHFRVEAMLELDRITEAESDMETLVADYPANPNTYVARILILLRSGNEKLDAEQYEEAIEVFTQLAEQSPTATHHALIGDVYWKQRNLEEADIHYRKALELDPKHCGANHALGRDAVLLKRYQDAIPYLDAANDLCADTVLHAQNLRFRVEAMLELNRITEAESDMETLVADYPANANTYEAGMLIARKKGNEALAAEYEEHLNASSDGDPQ